MAKVTMQQQIWNTLRIAKFCTFEDFEIACSSNLKKESVLKYLRLLIRIGYVAKNEDIYRLVRNTGRKAPAINTYKGVIMTDKNTKELLCLEEPKEYLSKIVLEKIKSLGTFTLFDLADLGTKYYIYDINVNLVKKGVVMAIGYKYVDKKRFKLFKYIGG